MDSSLRLAIVHNDGTTLICCAGEMDLATRDQLRDCLASVSGIIVLDFANVTFLDSSGIGVLARTAKRLRDDGGDLRIARAQAIQRKALEIVGLAELLEPQVPMDGEG